MPLVARFLAILGFFASTVSANGFRAGAATSNVTPPLGTSLNGHFTDRRAVHIHDELHARCLVLDDGTTKLAFVVVDSCMVPDSVVETAKGTIAEHTGIPASHVLVSATHTHEAPTAASVFQSQANPDYQKFLTTRIADGVRRANNNLAPAQIGWAVTQTPEHVFNRRWRMKPGVVNHDPFGGKSDQVKMNPAPGSPDLVEPSGPVDPEVWLVSVRSPDGKHIALLANYSLHYVGGEAPANVSADYFGMFCDRMTALLEARDHDPAFVAMMSNGTSGNINSINFRAPRPDRKPFERMREVAHDVAAKAAETVRSIQYQDTAKLSARSATLELGVRKPSAEEIARAKDILSGNPPLTPVRLDGVYAKETLAMAEYPDRVPVVVQAIRIGDLAIAAIPCEVFVEIGLDLKKNSPIKPLFTISLANGYHGYLPTPEHHKLGGYETWRAQSSYLEVDASTKIMAKLMELLGGS